MEKMNFSSRIKVDLEVIQPDWKRILHFLNLHIDCAKPIQIWFHSVAQCEGKFKLYLQLYCDSCHAKLIPFNFQSSKESANK